MQIKFLTIYHDLADVEDAKSNAQYALLGMWQNSLLLQNIGFVESAKVEFKDYGLFDYPNQERAKKEIDTAFKYQAKKTDPVEYWWAGKQYPDLDTLYSALAEQKRLMELVITLEDK